MSRLTAKKYSLVVTTQGPTYPPSEVMNEDGNFVVIGKLNLGSNSSTQLSQEWGGAIVSSKTPVPKFGDVAPYEVIRRFDPESITSQDDCMLYTLPLPLPCNNYPMIFSKEQVLVNEERNSLPLHEGFIPDLEPEHGRKITRPIMLSDWVKAKGELLVTLSSDKTAADFLFEFQGLIPNSLYTVMALREFDLRSNSPTRPGPLGVPNVFITTKEGRGSYQALMPNPFPKSASGGNRIISVVLLWMSSQMSYGGAIGHYGLGGDIHAQLKLPGRFFDEFETRA